MSTERTVRLSPEDLALKLATREAVTAAGGQVFVAGEVGRAQSRLSDYGSDNTAEFMPVNLVRRVEALGAGRPGHPHITSALARAAGRRIGGAAPTHDNLHVSDWLCDLAGEHADVVRALVDGTVRPGAARPSIRDMSAHARAVLSREIDQLLDVLGALKGELDTS